MVMMSFGPRLYCSGASAINTRHQKKSSVPSPWIRNSIRLKMNRRFNLFKRAVETKDPNTWADYKRLRNEIHLTLEKGNLLISEISLPKR